MIEVVIRRAQALASPRNPFSRPLKFGDPGQVQAMRALNGKTVYCPVCFEGFSRNFRPGELCPKCLRGRLELGAANVDHKRSIYDREHDPHG